MIEDKSKNESKDKNKILISAKNLREAIKTAAEKLGCPERNIRYQIIQNPRYIFFGLWSQSAKIIAWKHDALNMHVAEALRAASDIDGHISTELINSELRLTVYAPIGRGIPVSFEKVITNLREYEPDELDEEKVRDLVNRADGKSETVGRISKSGGRDGTFSIDVSKDGMEAYLTLFPPGKGGRKIDLEDIIKGLVREGIVYGLKEDIIKWAISENRYNESILIAEGNSPVPGADGRLEFKFRKDLHIIKLKEDEKGRVDYKNLELIEMVKAGDILIERIPSELGEAGKNVYGKESLPLSGKDVELPQGENIKVEGNTMLAGIEGHVIWSTGKVTISPVYYAKGDVNYSTGNIDFNGTVCIDGLVEDSFSVKAGGSIIVKKSIGKCKISAGGNVTVLGGILGRQEAEIDIDGDLVALFIENAKLKVKGNLITSEMILHSNAIVGGEIFLNGVRAALVGGSVTAGRDITVRSIGGEGTSRTSVRAGVKYKYAVKQLELKEEMARIDSIIEKIDTAIKQVESNKETSSDYVNTTKQLITRKNQIQLHLKALREESRTLENEIDLNSAHASINVYELVMPGTKIEIGNTSMVISNNIKYVTFKKLGVKINVMPYEGKSIE